MPKCKSCGKEKPVTEMHTIDAFPYGYVCNDCEVDT